MSETILVLNAGSSSIKFALYDAAAGQTPLHHGQVEKIGLAPHLLIKGADGTIVTDRTWPAEALDHAAATREILAASARLGGGRPIVAVGHRVVHGGVAHAAPVRITTPILAALEALIPLAPLHQPHNLAPIRLLAAEAPDLPQVACFDTAFHRDQPPLAQAFALPRALTESGIRRYGFHGLSYEFIAHRLREVAPAAAAGRVIVAHLGAGASLCAMHRGRSIASTMGFTALDGLMMGTRTGALDPGVILHLLDHHGMDAATITDLLYRRSGLLGVSGVSSDMRVLRASDDPHAREAIDLFVYRIIREIGSLAAALGGLDALIFTAGIGENDAATRSAVAAGCAWLGVHVDSIRNAAAEMRISPDSAAVSTWCIRTDEERMIAMHTLATLGLAA
jgi:acetate kinase